MTNDTTTSRKSPCAPRFPLCKRGSETLLRPHLCSRTPLHPPLCKRGSETLLRPHLSSRTPLHPPLEKGGPGGISPCAIITQSSSLLHALCVLISPRASNGCGHACVGNRSGECNSTGRNRWAFILLTSTRLAFGSWSR